MTYNIKAFEIFEKQTRNLDDKSARIVEDKIRLIKENPFRFSEKLTEIDNFKLRIGDWRVVADINKRDGIITILKVGHRKNVYD